MNFRLEVLRKVWYTCLGMINKIDGYKTYIIALSIGVVTALQYLGYIDASTGATIVMFLTGGGLATLRDAINKK